MSAKNYGTGTSGYLDPAERSWETTVYQASKPILDKELNLLQDAEQDATRKILRSTFPSGWVSDDYLASSASALFAGLTNTSNILQLNSLGAYVNGWWVNVTDTGNNTGLNVLNLGTAPSGAGASRTDLVILEVWRRLIPASPSTLGKSPAGRIWKNGNVKIASSDDMTLNYADDILDGAVGSETTKRVQIQYRLRVIHGVDLFTYPAGISDPTVVAMSVPPNAATPDGSSTVFTYVNQSSVGDPGLWLAGDGDPSNTLGTVDGRMFALPLAAIFRRNSTAFARNTNQNGGIAFGGSSDRPDGLFYDIISARDVLDMRSGSSPTGWDLTEVLQKNVNLLFDNVNQTEIGSTLFGGGMNGHTIIQADEIGVSNANGGDGVITGDTPGADFIGEFDSVRRSFSDRGIYETVVLKYLPSGGSWATNEVVTISPSNLPIWPYANTNWAAHAPSNISFVEITRVAFLGEAGGSNSTDITHSGWFSSGLGTTPQGAVTVQLTGAGAAAGGSSPIFIWITVAYPSGVGLSKTPTTILGNNGTAGTVQGVYINNPGQLPATTPIYYNALTTPVFTQANREVQLTYQTVAHTRNYYSTGATTTLFIPERIDSSQPVTVTINSVPYGGSQVISGDGYFITVAGGAVTGGQTIVITYQSIRPMPQNNEQLTVYYEARVPQTVRDALLGTSLSVVPRSVAQHLYVLTAGSGTDGQAYPFPYQYVQAGGVYPTSGGSFAGDHELDGDLRLSTTTLTADTGFMQLSVQVPVTPAPEAVTFVRSPGAKDIEGRTFFNASGTPYYFTGIAQTLSDPKKHKNILAMLCELSADTLLGPKGQLVLVLLSRWAIFDDSNSVGFVTNLANNSTTASVYRLKGNLLSNRRS